MGNNEVADILSVLVLLVVDANSDFDTFFVLRYENGDCTIQRSVIFKSIISIQFDDFLGRKVQNLLDSVFNLFCRDELLIDIKLLIA